MPVSLKWSLRRLIQRTLFQYEFYTKGCAFDFFSATGEPEVRYKNNVCNPIFFSMTSGLWLITGYQQARSLLLDKRISSNPENSKLIKRRKTSSNATVEQSIYILSTIDPPKHTALRSLVNQAFSNRRIALLSDLIEKRVSCVLNSLDGVKELDLVADFADKVPGYIIGNMLGIPEHDMPKLHSLSSESLEILSDKRTNSRSPSLATKDLNDYFRKLIDQPNLCSHEGLIHELTNNDKEQNQFGNQELAALISFIFTAGMDTTVALISSGMKLLLNNPGQLAMLRKNPELIESAVNEFLRLAPPVKYLFRFVGEDIEANGIKMKAGEVVLVSLMGSNLDPNQFSNPNDLNIKRQGNTHLGLGAGIHSCLGNLLAKLQTKIAILALLDKYPTITLKPTQTCRLRNRIINRWAEVPVVVSTDF